MSLFAQQVIADINSYMRQTGESYPLWYVGIASSPRDRLFGDHGVDERRDRWIYRPAASSDIARSVERHTMTPVAMEGRAVAMPIRSTYTRIARVAVRARKNLGRQSAMKRLAGPTAPLTDHVTPCIELRDHVSSWICLGSRNWPYNVKECEHGKAPIGGC